MTHPGGIEVTNFPASQTVDGTVNVGNFPATQPVSGNVGVNNFPANQTVSGTVGVNNFPANQTVNGTVGVNNFPASQTVSGTVDIGNVVTVQPEDDISHLGQPIGEHVKMSLNGHPPLLQFGLILFQEEGSTGGSSAPSVSEGECLVILDIAVTFQSVEETAPLTLGAVPFGVAQFEYGLTNGTTLLRFGEIMGAANEGAIGRAEHSFGAGLVFTKSGFDETATDFALESIPITVAGATVIPSILGAHATGYRIPC